MWLLVLESLDYISKGRKTLVDVLGFVNPVLVFFFIDFLASSQINKRELSQSHFPVSRCFLEVKLAVRAATEVGGRFKVLFRVQQNLEHCMTSRAQFVLDGLISLPLSQSLPVQLLRLLSASDDMLANIVDIDESILVFLHL